jgi:GntR family transcriptional regulator
MANEEEKAVDRDGALKHCVMTEGTKTGRGVDFSRSDVPRYLQLATLFRRRIETGGWSVGQQIPTIDILMKECGVARDTVRQALGVLARDGWIERFRAKGTFVRDRPRLNELFDISHDVTGLFWALEGMNVEFLSEPVSSPLPMAAGTIGDSLADYIHHRKRHWRSEVPFLVTDNYYDAAIYDNISAEDWENRGALTILIDQPGVEISDIRQTLTIATADIETATLLQLPLNAPVARVQRTAVNPVGQIVFYGDALYRGENIRLDIKLK